MGIINGVGVVVESSGKILLGLRNAGVWSGHWCLPGGKIDQGESLLDCGRRELLEETGLLAVGAGEIFSVSSEVDPSRDFHSITFGARFEAFCGSLANREPHKFSEWRWFGPEELPAPLFRPTESVLSLFFARKGDSGLPSASRALRQGEFVFALQREAMRPLA